MMHLLLGRFMLASAIKIAARFSTKAGTLKSCIEERPSTPPHSPGVPKRVREAVLSQHTLHAAAGFYVVCPKLYQSLL
eukprot:6203126-Pleurochrysis_carterae.AAC.1